MIARSNSSLVSMIIPMYAINLSMLAVNLTASSEGQTLADQVSVTYRLRHRLLLLEPKLSYKANSSSRTSNFRGDCATGY